MNIFDILDVKEQELRIYKTFGRRLLQTHVGFLDEDLFNRCIKGDQEREQSLKSLIESYRQVVLSKSKYPVEIQEISEEWVEQIESNKTSNSWTKLWQSVFE